MKRGSLRVLNNKIVNIERLQKALFLPLIIISLVFFTFVILFLPQISSVFSVGTPNYSIQDIYGPSASVTGWINISFSSESLDSLFEDGRGNSANLSTILKGNTGYPYTCSPLSCDDDYSVSTPSSEKTTTLNSGSSKIYGIRLTGIISNINSLEFEVESNAPPSCLNQLEVDFLDDGVIDFKNTNAAEGGSCGNLKNSGCFSTTPAPDEIEIVSPVCQRINLSDSPGFLIGGWVKKTGAQGNVIAAIYKKISSSLSDEVAKCTLPDATESGGEVSCSVDYSVIKPEEHYVCLYLGSETGEYKTKGYSATGSAACGFYGTPIKTETAAYQIFAQGKQFDSFGSHNLNKSSSGESFANMAETYLLSKYGNFNCTDGCIIPVKITSRVSGQEITLKNLEVNYQKDIGVVTEINLYDVSKTPAKITSNFNRLYIDQGGFTVPNKLGDYDFTLSFNDDEIIEKELEVKDVPIIKSVNPLKAAAAFPTEFTLSVDSDYNLTNFSWDFGDNKFVTTRVNKTTHTYNQTGEYTLRVSVTDNRQLSSSKTFTINVSSPRDLINFTIIDLRASLASIKTGISSLDSFSKSAINASLNLAQVESSLNTLENSYKAATTEAQYTPIVTGLLAINLPESIFKTSDGEGPLISGPDYVDIDVLQRVVGGTAGQFSDEDYANAVLAWQQENLEVTMIFNEFSGRYDSSLSPLVKTFRISVEELGDIPYDYYFIMPELPGFTSDSSYDTESGYVYVNLRETGSFSFSTTSDIGFTDLPAFISPSISRLSVEAITPPEEDKTSKWITFGLIILALIVIGVVTYIILQEWYRRKYEHHLFPNRNDLYNMANYINNAKRKGLHKTEIEANLKKAGWSSERIRYAMRKYMGKRTGMLEIPITGIIKKIEGEDKKNHR
jgi:hypothetical protein